MKIDDGERLLIFSTCPQSKDIAREDYLQEVAQVARWSEESGCEGILVYTDNSLVDAWLVSQVILQSTQRLCPLVATQPVYMHPYAVAKMVASFGALYGRRLWLNMVAGGFRNDLIALNDTTPHDKRYQRLLEYGLVVRKLLESPNPVTFEGEFYKVHTLRMTPPLDAALTPGLLVSGSSEAGVEAARALGAVAVKYPQPASYYLENPVPEGHGCGIRVGIIARRTEQQAWAVAEARFPGDRRGQIAHQLAMKVSDSHWHKQLSDTVAENGMRQGAYWMWPFENYKTFCPYLVGDYDQVAEQISLYVGAGYRTYILDIPPSREELDHVHRVFEHMRAAA
ncbi:MAG: alkanesulfonate monooxygenase [Betaproteobacteria bacterium RIFCSPLOWO2_02_FULL_65_24]|nr:MAG: alkanesulfonate monooxygenase [Betaproteobacteria bacterium RIFCSPLOWO2_02_FULL_65_24]